ncbi:hypothetical protein D3C85_1554550 [compost metagenome]
MQILQLSTNSHTNCNQTAHPRRSGFYQFLCLLYTGSKLHGPGNDAEQAVYSVL